jgi:hypothetical protein
MYLALIAVVIVVQIFSVDFANVRWLSKNGYSFHTTSFSLWRTIMVSVARLFVKENSRRHSWPHPRLLFADTQNFPPMNGRVGPLLFRMFYKFAKKARQTS